MRFTRSLHKGVDYSMMFKAHWLIQRKTKIISTPAESILLSQGVQIFDPNDVLRPAIIEEPYVPHIEEEVKVPEEKPPCYIINNLFRPLENLNQTQLITNSLVFNSFPEKIQSKIQPLAEDEKEYLKDIILHSAVLDAEQRKLKRATDFQKFPGYIAPREYGIRPNKKISSLIYNILLHLEQTRSSHEVRNILEDVSSKVTLNHGEKLMHLNHESCFMSCSKTPMEPSMTSQEVKALEGEPLPDLFPLSPFIHCKKLIHYNFKEGFGISGGSLAPHTVFVACKDRPFRLKSDIFCAMSLVYAFSFAASYAKEVNKGVTGRLEKPVTVNIVHTNGQYIHTGRFQLNTLDSTDSIRNVFWHSPPWEALYQDAGFDSAKPMVGSVNPQPLEVLKALY